MLLLTPPGSCSYLAQLTERKSDWSALNVIDRNLSNRHSSLGWKRTSLYISFSLWFTLLQNCLTPKLWANNSFPATSGLMLLSLRSKTDRWKKCSNKSKPMAAPRFLQMNVGINFSLNITKINSSKNITLCFVHSIIVFQLFGSTRCYWHRQVESGQQCFYPLQLSHGFYFGTVSLFLYNHERGTRVKPVQRFDWTECGLSHHFEMAWNDYLFVFFYAAFKWACVVLISPGCGRRNGAWLLMQFFFRCFFVLVLVRWKSIFNTDTFE